MAGEFLNTVERERLSRFPSEISHEDMITFFTLSPGDMQRVPRYSAPHNQLGFAMQLCALRYLGFSPDDIGTAPPSVVAFVGQQVGVEPDALAVYGDRPQTRSDHLLEIMAYLGFRRASADDLNGLSKWLLERALEHSRPTLLFQLASEKLKAEKIVRPGVTHLERMVITVRNQAQKEIYRRLSGFEGQTKLDELLLPDKSKGCTPLVWLRRGATSNSPNAILEALEKIACLRHLGVESWDLTVLNPNRLKLLAQLGRKATNQALQRTPEERRYPILIGFLKQSLVDITDETIEMYDRCLWEAYARAGHDLKDFRESVARTTNEKVRLFREIGQIILDSEVADAELRKAIYAAVPPEMLRSEVEECSGIIRPLDDNYFDFMGNRYGYIRRFAPAFIGTFGFHSNLGQHDSLLKAVALLCRLNTENHRSVPEDAPLDFIPSKWRPYVLKRGGQIDRHYYELCVLWELRNALRAGNIWLEGSRRYANPQTYLIPKENWPALKAEVCHQVQVSENGAERLGELQIELEDLLGRADKRLSDNKKVRFEADKLVVSPLEGEELPKSSARLQDAINERLPQLDLTELLIEVDSWTHFTDHFEHAGGSESRTKNLLVHLYASILAQACNLGLTTMAQIADLSYDQLAWCTNWYLREETLKTAFTAIVNYQYHQPLSQFWGGGTLSSSDGQRFPVSGKTRSAAALPRYFGYGRGLTFYTWTSDQFSQYGTKVIPATVRDATYVLDEILDNETELPIVEHTTDTTGYTELVFALFDLLGLRFSPRIRDIADQRLYRFSRKTQYRNLEPMLKGTINSKRITERWDDLLRVAGSLKLGWVTASLLITKLQSYPRQNALTQALQEYGRVVKTVFILRYLESEEYRQRISIQLNKGEALHGLRSFLLIGKNKRMRHRQLEDQANQASCLNLVTNAVVTWNTVYMNAVIEQLKREGEEIQDSDLVHLSPARYEHINPYGKYYFDIEKELGRNQLRPLRHA